MIAGIVLAAGTSRRLGQPKQLLPFRGGTVLGSTLGVITGVLPRVAVVLGAAAGAIIAQGHLQGATVIINPDYQQGQASSLVVGLQAATTWPYVEAVIVCLGDQPTIRAEAIQSLVDMYSLAIGNITIGNVPPPCNPGAALWRTLGESRAVCAGSVADSDGSGEGRQRRAQTPHARRTCPVARSAAPCRVVAG